MWAENFVLISFFSVIRVNGEADNEKGCKLPQTPYNGNYEVKGCEGVLKDPFFGPCWKNPAVLFPVGQEVTYYCLPAYILKGAKNSTCLPTGKWSTASPRCCKPRRGQTNAEDAPVNQTVSIDVFQKPQERALNSNDQDQISCPLLLPTNHVEFDCRTPDGRTKSCDEPPLPPSTVAHLRCARYYKSDSTVAYRYRKCKLDGEWSTEGTITCIPDCGRSDKPRQALITNGVTSVRGQWPWHAAIYLKSAKGSWEYICGGSLISKQVIITAAHCVTKEGTEEVQDPRRLTIILGKYFRQFETTDEGEQRRTAERIITHPSYSAATYDSDIAFIILKSPVEFSFYVSPVCVPANIDSIIEDYQLQPGNLGTVLGWGNMETGELADKLQEAHLPVISARDCIDSYKDFFKFQTRYTNYCAGYLNGTGVCHGDSGGSMVFPTGQGQQQRWYIQGIVSAGISDSADKNRCNTHAYALFTRVGRYQDWIVSTLTPDGYL